MRPDLTTVPVEDVDPVETVVATRAGESGDLVAEFVALARHHVGPAVCSRPS